MVAKLIIGVVPVAASPLCGDAGRERGYQWEEGGQQVLLC